MHSFFLLATEAGGGGLDSILPAEAELFWGAVAFVIVYLVLDRLAFPMLNRTLDERAESIRGRLEEAEERFAEAESVKSDYESRLSEARTEANRIIDEARSTAESLRRDRVEQAEQEARSIVERARQEVAAERDRALQELRADVGRMSIQLAGKIVEKELDPGSHRDLVEHYIQNVARQN